MRDVYEFCSVLSLIRQSDTSNGGFCTPQQRPVESIAVDTGICKVRSYGDEKCPSMFQGKAS